ncbi:MAG: PP2C family protein-serine/threonine phosphatase [Anaerolineales bacterium]
MANIIQRLFGSSGDDETLIEAPPVAAESVDGSRNTQVSARPPMRVAYAQSVGQMRDHNEDALLALTATFAGHEYAPEFGLYIVADGMGGHSMGERASAVATRATARSVAEHFYLSMMADDDDGVQPPPLQEVLDEALQYANRQVAGKVGDGGGTTATVALVVGERVTIAHVGDSRAYFVTSDGLEQLTRDHSLVQRLQELGQLTAEEAAVHPQKNVLYRAVGQGEGLEVDVQTHTFPAGAQLLICSDGLWGLVDDPQLQAIIEQSSSMQDACERMVQAANDAGGPDNITALMVAFDR